jgi:hypothetical protein
MNLQRVSGLEDLQTQVNQVKVNMGMPRYTSTDMKDDPSEGFDTGFASWDEPTPSNTGNHRATTHEGRRSPGDTTGMGPIPEGNETKRTNSQASLRKEKNKTPIPSQSRNQTPIQSRNQTPNGNQTPRQNGSRNQTPVQSRLVNKYKVKIDRTQVRGEKLTAVKVITIFDAVRSTH